jgi:hypothetical protein
MVIDNIFEELSGLLKESQIYFDTIVEIQHHIQTKKIKLFMWPGGPRLKLILEKIGRAARDFGMHTKAISHHWKRQCMLCFALSWVNAF